MLNMFLDSLGLNHVIIGTCPAVMGTWERAWERSNHYRSHCRILKNNNKFSYGNEGTSSRARMRKFNPYLSFYYSLSNDYLLVFFLACDLLFYSLVPISKKLIKKHWLIVGTNQKTGSRARSHVPMNVTKSMLLKASSQQ